MCPLVFAGFAPHPALLIEGVGDELKREARPTDKAYKQLAASLLATKPSTVVVVSPHGPVFADTYTIAGWDTLVGDFTPFGSPVSMVWSGAKEYIERARKLAEERGLPLAVINSRQLANHRYSPNLDHGTMVPLWYLQQAGWQGTIACVRIGGLPPDQCYDIGKILAAAATDEDVALIASGDLSHCLSEDGPSPYNPAGAEFDKLIADSLAAGDYEAVLSIPVQLRQRAAECGWRPLVTLLGALSGRKTRSEVLSYQGPYGVGYLIAAFPFLAGEKPEGEISRPNHTAVSEHASLAKEAIQTYLTSGKVLELPQPPLSLATPAAAFVSLKLAGQLRGCMGTIEPARENLAAEIVANAIAAATKDPRFKPLSREELAEVAISVDVLSPPEPAEFSDLAPAKFGLIAQWQGRRGLLLPDLAGVDSPEEQLRIVCQKAGIPWDKAEEAQLFIFRVKRFY